MGAFDPSALAPPTSVRTPRSNSNLSPRAAATLAAMDSEGMGMRGDSPYGAASGSRNGAHSRPGMGRRASESSITMGFPSTQVSGKGQALIEIYGVRYALPIFLGRPGGDELIYIVLVIVGTARHGKTSVRVDMKQMERLVMLRRRTVLESLVGEINWADELNPSGILR